MKNGDILYYMFSVFKTVPLILKLEVINAKEESLTQLAGTRFKVLDKLCSGFSRDSHNSGDLVYGRDLNGVVGSYKNWYVMNEKEIIDAIFERMND